MIYLGIDPGPKLTAVVYVDFSETRGLDCCDILSHQIRENEELIDDWRVCPPAPNVTAIEMIASYGMAVGKEVFETCVVIGRIIQVLHRLPVRRIFRREVKIELCGSMKAKDSNIRQALIDAIGPQGTKKAPGPTYGIRADEWSALAIAYTAWKQDQCNG